MINHKDPFEIALAESYDELLAIKPYIKDMSDECKEAYSNRLAELEDDILKTRLDMGYSTKDSIGKHNRERGVISQYEVEQGLREPKHHMTYDFAIIAYRHVLNNGGTRDEALEAALEISGKAEEWLEETKNRKFFYAKSVVEYFDKTIEDSTSAEDKQAREEQKKMVDNGTMDKSALKQSNTLNQQLGRLSRNKRVSDELERLKKVDAEQQKQIDNLDKTITSQEIDVNRLKELTGLEDIPPKDKAKILKNKGFNQKEIAEMTGKSLSTIKRWWKEL